MLLSASTAVGQVSEIPTALHFVVSGGNLRRPCIHTLRQVPSVRGGDSTNVDVCSCQPAYYILYVLLVLRVKQTRRPQSLRRTAPKCVPPSCVCLLFTLALRCETLGHPRGGGDFHPSRRRRGTAGNRQHRHVCRGHISSRTNRPQLHRTAAADSLRPGTTTRRHEPTREHAQSRAGRVVRRLQRD